MFAALRRPVLPALVIDANPTTRPAVAAALQAAAFTVEAVDNSHAARQCVRQRRVELIVSDLYLDDEPGEWLVRDLLQCPDMEDVPVMFLTARQIPDVILRSFGSQGAYHLRKPVDARVLTDLASTVLAASPRRVTFAHIHSRGPLRGPTLDRGAIHDYLRRSAAACASR
ncbi:MAG: response regulator [Pirellulales bacterium]